MGLIEHIEAEWNTFKRAPLAFGILCLLFVSAGIAIGSWHYGERIETMQMQIHNYKVALGTVPASKGALVALSNEELALRAESLVAALRRLDVELAAKLEPINRLESSGKITRKQSFQDKLAAMQSISQYFDTRLASDTYNVEDEIQKRLEPAALSHVLRVPRIQTTDGNGIPITATARGTGFDAMFLGTLADEIEQMAKLLPDK